MKLKITGNRDWLYNTVKDIANMFTVELVEEDQIAKCWIQVELLDQQVTAKAVFSFDKEQPNTKPELLETVTAAKEEDLVNQEKRLVKKAFYRLLQEACHHPGSPWGILTGIRPTKLVHRLWDQQLSKEEITNYLREQYLISQAKSQLLINTTLHQRKFLLSPQEAGKKVGIYLGIPFCPSRCLYCSFPAYSLVGLEELKDNFLAALHKEIEAVGKLINDENLTVQHIYVGGGTPTSLSVTEMNMLLDLINRYIRCAETEEVTVEAGRPDTLNFDMVKLFKESQVTRISVNPQTLQAKTLKNIGREHTPEEFWRAYDLAKNTGIPVVNVDIILGLPGEKAADVAGTLSQLGRVQLDNLTVHSMALKRASKLMEKGSGAFQRDDSGEGEIIAMAKLAADFALSQGLIPYYLYRQKRIKGLGENIGYSKLGLESIYNIQIMEERQTIIGLGGGAGSKWVNPGDWTLSATYNPKDPLTYINNIESIIKKKYQLIREVKLNADNSSKGNK